MKTLLCTKISSFDQTSTSLKIFWFLANHLDSKKKKKKRFLRIIYITDYVCLLKMFFISYIFSGQWFAQSFWECVNHARHCMFDIVLGYVTLHWISLANFLKTSSSCNQGKRWYPWDFVFSFDPLQCFFVFELNFL